MRHARGLTLIELLMVIALAMTLIAILLPALGRVRKIGRQTSCASNLRQIVAAHVAHSNDNDGTIIPIVTQDGEWWTVSLLDYHDGDDVLYCPETRVQTTPVLGTLGFGGRDSTWFDGIQYPSDPMAAGSYGQNMWVNDFRDSVTLWGHPADLHWGATLEMVDSTKIPLVADCVWVGGYPYDSDVPSATEWDGTLGGGHQTNRYATNRHNDAVEVGFIDGSARHVNIPDLWTLRWNHEYTPQAVTVPWL